MITRDRDAKRYPVNVPRASVPGYVRVIYALCFLAVLRPDYVVGRENRPGRLEPVYKGAEGEQRGGGRAQARENAHAAVEAAPVEARRRLRLDESRWQRVHTGRALPSISLLLQAW
jgi:hypothetical protein